MLLINAKHNSMQRGLRLKDTVSVCVYCMYTHRDCCIYATIYKQCQKGPKNPQYVSIKIDGEDIKSLISNPNCTLEKHRGRRGKCVHASPNTSLRTRLQRRGAATALTPPGQKFNSCYSELPLALAHRRREPAGITATARRTADTVL